MYFLSLHLYHQAEQMGAGASEVKQTSAYSWSFLKIWAETRSQQLTVKRERGIQHWRAYNSLQKGRRVATDSLETQNHYTQTGDCHYMKLEYNCCCKQRED